MRKGSPKTSMRAVKNGIATVLVAVLGLGLSGCGKKVETAGPKSEEEAEMKGAKPEERPYLEAARPFVEALAGRDYAGVYAQLSRHGRARMSLNQFVPATDQAVFKQREEEALAGVSVEKFLELMALVEQAHGSPRKTKALSVYSLNPEVLNRRGTEPFSKMDSMFAVGAMPESAEVRRASLRGQISTELSAEELARIAQEQGVTVEELKKDSEFYFTFKVVLVEEEGGLKVGYFEFLPPSMMD